MSLATSGPEHVSFTIPELAWLVREAGFSGSAVELFTAILWRESRGDARALGDVDNPSPGCASFGLAQINVCPNGNNAGVAWRENPRLLFDPRQNLRAAFEMSGGGRDFGPWGYGPNAYRGGVAAPDVSLVGRELSAAGGPQQPSAAKLQAAGAAVGATDTATTQPTEGGGLGEAVAKLTSPETWKLVGWALAGAGLVVVGLLMLGNETIQKAGRTIIAGSSSGTGKDGPSVAAIADDVAPTVAATTPTPPGGTAP